MRLLTLLFCLICSTAWPAEMLVLMNDNGSDIAGRRGDIIVVRPDGWQWGNEECPPIYQVVKIPGLSEADAKQYENTISSTDTTDPEHPRSVIVQLRQYSVDLDAVSPTGGKGMASMSGKSQSIESGSPADESITITTDDIIDKEQ